MPDLHIRERLRNLLPPLTTEERQQLKENIEHDGRVNDPIFYWYDGKHNVVVDGMNRWEIVQELGSDKIPYGTEELSFDNYEAAEIWILNHQLGRRNLLEPAAIRKVRGELYNRLKTTPGGDRQSEEALGQNVRLLGDAATEVAEKSGVSERTVRRDGARVANLDKLTKAAKAIAEKATDKEIKNLSVRSPADQDGIARAVRTGLAGSLGEALGLKPSSEAGKYGKCPSCGKTKWTSDEFGVSCSGCNHPHGEPVGDVEEQRVTTARSKTIKTVEALMRAFDDLNKLMRKPEHPGAIQGCERLLVVARGWK